ncbi:MAG: WD40/YVTN/BNR-like repeat-containing protein, partial [Planctomycetota bacterium]
MSRRLRAASSCSRIAAGAPFAALAVLAALPCLPAQEPRGPVPNDLLATLEWRLVGPFRGGRVAAVAGVAGERDTYYMGACGGGVWKTTAGGTSWRNVSDGTFGGSIGAVAVAPSDPRVVYVGGGEKTWRGNVSSGDGVWKSTDAGATWSFA